MSDLVWRLTFRWRFYEPIIFNAGLRQRDVQVMDAVQEYRDKEAAEEALARMTKFGAIEPKLRHILMGPSLS